VKYDREIAKLQAEQASVGKTKNAEPHTRWDRDRIAAFLRGFGLSSANVDKIAKRWDDDADLAFWAGYDSGQDSMSDY
jgi:hypothetical protein